MSSKLLVLSVILLFVVGCDVPDILLAYPVAVLDNWIAGAWQGGLANPQGLMQGALVNGFWNLTGLVPLP